MADTSQAPIEFTCPEERERWMTVYDEARESGIQPFYAAGIADEDMQILRRVYPARAGAYNYADLVELADDLLGRLLRVHELERGLNDAARRVQLTELDRLRERVNACRPDAPAPKDGEG